MLLSPVKRLRLGTFPKTPQHMQNYTPLGVDAKGKVVVNSSWDAVKLVGNIDQSLEKLLNDVVGPHARSIVVDHISRRKEENDATALELFLKYPTSRFQRILIQISGFRKKVLSVLYHNMVKGDTYMSNCRKELEEAFVHIEEKIKEDTTGQFDLDKPIPSASVIAIASLCYPVLVEDMRDTSLSFTFYHKELQDEIMRWRSTGLGQWCLKVYKAYPDKY